MPSQVWATTIPKMSGCSNELCSPEYKETWKDNTYWKAEAVSTSATAWKTIKDVQDLPHFIPPFHPDLYLK